MAGGSGAVSPRTYSSMPSVSSFPISFFSKMAGSVYLGVGGVNPTAKEVAEALAHGAGLDGKTVSITLEQARAEMGPVADAFALDQQFTPAKARRELGWEPRHTDPLAVFASN